MMFVRTLLVVCAMGLLAGCGGVANGPDGAKPSGGAGAAGAGGNRAMNIPAGAELTIYVATCSGPNHIADCKQVKTTLESVPQLKNLHDWYIVHGDGQSVLYHGYYKNPAADPRDGERAKSDQRAISSLVDNSTGQRLFSYTPIVSLDTADPSAPPEYDLANAKGYWSLQVAAFQNVENRKQAAVEAVLAARKQRIEAYYFHGPTVSSVCIGAWPESAVKRQESDHVEAADANQPLLVLPGDVNLPGRDFKTSDGEKLRVMQPKLEVLDPGMLRTMRQFPEHAVDYMTKQKKMADGTVRGDPSFLVIIPHTQPTRGNPANPDGFTMPDLGLTPSPQPSGGRLRSLDK